MKIPKPLFLALSLILLCASLGGCTGSSSHTQNYLSPPESNTAEELRETVPQDTKVPTVQESEVLTETPTEASTEEATQNPEELEAQKQAMLKEIYDATEAIQLPIGGWSTPASALRDGYTSVTGSYDKVFETIAASGDRKSTRLNSSHVT